MQKQELQQWIKDNLLDSKQRFNTKLLNSKKFQYINKDILDLIDNYINHNFTIKEKCKIIIEQVSVKICNTCGKVTLNKNFCSYECAHKSKSNTRKLYIQTSEPTYDEYISLLKGYTKYIKIYLQIIKNIKKLNRQKIKNDGLERHHILPKSLFSKFKDLKYNKWNGVLLTPKEHRIIHKLIYKHYLKLNYNIGIIKMGQVLVHMFNVNSSVDSFSKKAKSIARKLEGSTITDQGREKISKKMKENNPSKTKNCFCIYCEQYMNKSTYTQFHGLKCKKHPNYVKPPLNIDKSNKLKSQSTFVNAFTHKNELLNINIIPFEYYSTNSNSYIFTIEYNNKFVYILNKKVFEYFCKLHNHSTDYFTAKLGNIFFKDMYSEYNKKYYDERFEGLTFNKIKVKDFNFNKLTNENIYLGEDIEQIVVKIKYL